MPHVTDATPDPPALSRARARAHARAAGSVTHIVPEMPMQPLVTLSVIALCGLLTVSAFAGPVLVAATVALAAGIIAWGWPGLLGLPSPRGTTFVVAVGAAAAIGTVLATRGEPFLEWMPAALAGSLIVAFLHQLARRDGRPRLVESIASNITAIAIIVSGATFVVLPRTEQGAQMVALAMGAVAASAVTELAGASTRLRGWLLPLGMLAGGLAGLAVGLLLGAVIWGPAALLGGLVAAVGHAVRRVLAVLPAISGPRSQLVSACASVLTVGVVVYVAGRLLEA
jgi:hypothetical protein